ncbi:MAG: aminoglycoside phosphotransferase family protein [bacterium]|nr:aminoglycoside phosphotransferase family protein [bacterium]
MVVKRFRPKEGEKQKESLKEVSALLALIVNDVIMNGIQRGHIAYKNREGDYFIISEKIQGQKPDPQSNQFNDANLSQMATVLAKLDTPDVYWNMKKPFKTPRKNSLLMHYDLKPGNVLISPDNFGVIDFEYLDFINIPRFKVKKEKNWGIITNYSDISGIPSNLRNFEYRTLLPYLMKLEPQEANKLFIQYLKHKSDYYNDLSIEYPRDKHYSKIIKLQQAHYNVLRKPTKDVIKTEAIKIQIARYLYLLSTHAHGEKTEINLNEIKQYIINAQKFFENQYNFCCNPNEKTYFMDCIELINVWRNIIPIINSNKIEELDYYKDISGCNNNDNSNKSIKTTYTDKHIPTLDEKVAG